MGLRIHKCVFVFFGVAQFQYKWNGMDKVGLSRLKKWDIYLYMHYSMTIGANAISYRRLSRDKCHAWTGYFKSAV